MGRDLGSQEGFSGLNHFNFKHDSAAPAAASLRVGQVFLASLGTKQTCPPIV